MDYLIVDSSEYKIRHLKKQDYHKGFMQILSQLTLITQPSYKEFCNQYDQVINSTNLVFVIEDHHKIIATAKLVIEPKFHNGFKSIGHIEDVVVDVGYRKKGIGLYMVKYIVKLYKTYCYKIVLNCNENNVEFYEKCGFKKKGTEMTIYS